MIEKQKGMASFIAMALIMGAFVVGVVCEKYTKAIDSPIEQAAEAVLDAHGVDIDFSADKKKEREDDIEEQDH